MEGAVGPAFPFHHQILSQHQASQPPFDSIRKRSAPAIAHEGTVEQVQHIMEGKEDEMGESGTNQQADVEQRCYKRIANTETRTRRHRKAL